MREFTIPPCIDTDALTPWGIVSTTGCTVYAHTDDPSASIWYHYANADGPVFLENAPGEQHRDWCFWLGADGYQPISHTMKALIARVDREDALRSLGHIPGVE